MFQIKPLAFEPEANNEEVMSVLGFFSRLLAKNAKYIPIILDFVLFISLFLVTGILITQNSEYLDFVCTGAVLYVIWLVLAFARSLYHRLLIDESVAITSSLSKMWLLYLLICFTLYSMLLHKVFSLKVFVLVLAALTVCFIFNKIIFLSFRKRFKKHFIKIKKVAVIGSSLIGGRRPHYRYFYDGNVHYEIMNRWYHEKDIQLKNDGEKKSDIYKMYKDGVTEIYCCMFAFDREEVKQLLTTSEKYMIRVRFLPTIGNLLQMPLSVNYIGKIPVLSPRREPLLSEYNYILKRSFDIIFSSFVIVFVLSWLYPLIGLLIKSESRGPVLFKQKRSGMDNKPFMCYKFRSMVVNQHSDSVQATKTDARITRIGAFLRRTSLDELPQFFNVLKGEMSVVGPRPHMLSHTEQYRKQVDSFMVRQYVKPGITGLAQVSGYRGETREVEMMEKRVKSDIKYLQNWSFMLDMKIIFLTVWNVFKGEQNAY
ncbi:MAG: exopolysaccharide biosynthesis polyprenyl glycosylphosphotransferase [Niabella sp.]